MVDENGTTNYIEQIKLLEKLLNSVDPNTEIYKNTKKQLEELKVFLEASETNKKIGSLSNSVGRQ